MSFPVEVIFAHPDAGYEGDQAHAKLCRLVPGQAYQIRSVQVGQSSTMLELAGFKDERFSSVLFEPAGSDPDDDPDGGNPYLVLSGLTLSAVQAEATRAHLKHGDQSMAGPSHTQEDRFAILAEEGAEASDEALGMALDLLAKAGQLTGHLGAVARELNEIRLGNHDDDDRKTRLVIELIQTAAMALTWVETLEGGLS